MKTKNTNLKKREKLKKNDIKISKQTVTRPIHRT